MRFPFIGLTLVTVMTALTVWLDAKGVLAQPFALVAYGANFPPWWREVWRLPTSNLLHASYSHLLPNATVLLIACAWIEKWRAQTTAALLASGIIAPAVTAAVLSAWPRAAYVVGASGFVYAAFGIWCTRLQRGVWHHVCFAVVALHCVLSLTESVSMHLTGFVAGAALSRMLGWRPLLAVYAVSLIASLLRATPEMIPMAVRAYTRTTPVQQRDPALQTYIDEIEKSWPIE